MKRFSTALCLCLVCFLLLCSAEEAAEGSRETIIARLRALGFLSVSNTGEMESDLYDAVFNFQKANGIPASGSLDPTTSQSILSEDAVSFSAYLESYSRPVETDLALGFKDSGKNVRNLQSALSDLGYYTGELSEEYTVETACAVALFEAVNGFEPDGYADRYVIGKLLSPSALGFSGFERLQTLAFGDRGVLVKYCQRLLQSLGYFEGAVSGVFGENTRKAVISFEQHNGLEPTGTWQISYTVMARNARALSKSDALAKELAEVLSPGDKSYRVYEIKLRLSKLGYYTGALDEVFDERLQNAILAFQEANSLDMTGIADTGTQERLYADDCVQMTAFALEKEVCALQYGQTGYGVYLMTRRLQQLGYPLETGRTYDDQVSAAVTVFQYAQDLDVIGAVDPDARRLMNSSRALTYTQAIPIAREKQAQSEQAQEYAAFMQAVDALIGKPYEAGMTGPDSFGIGGFTYYCYSMIQTDIPPTAALQLDSAQQSGALISDIAQINGGSQLFFRDQNQLYTGIVTRDQKLAYASPSQGKVVQAEVSTLLEQYEFAGLVVYFYGP